MMMIRRLYPRSSCRPRLRPIAALALLTLSILPGARLQAQTPPNPAQAASEQADALFDGRQYKNAAAAYTALLKAYPNSEYATAAQFHLAYADFLINDFQPALDLLHKLQTSPTTPPDMQDEIQLLLPQVFAQQATALPEGAERDKGFTAAVKEYDIFVTKYPKSTSLESALYGRAISKYQLRNYADAVTDLRRNLQSFPRSGTILDSEFLLAIALATQSNLALAKEGADEPSRAAAFKGYEEAESHLRNIITQNTDISLANDAQFQLGETLFAHAAASAANPVLQGRLYQDTLAAYRAVEPKAPMIVAQTDRMDRISQALLAERRKGAAFNKDAARQLDLARLREAGKLETLRGKEDPVLEARLKAGAVFFSLQRYDEARLLLTTLLPLATKPADEKLALYDIALTYISQKQIEKAVAAYDKFQGKFSGDPMAENLPILLSGLFQSGDKPDPEKSKHYLDDFSRLYPNSKLRETFMLQKANTSVAQGKYDEALETYDSFLKGSPKRELAATGEFGRALALDKKGDLPKALAAFTKVRDTYKDRPEGESASFWVGYVQAQSKDAPGALKTFQAFVTQYPDSKLQPPALSSLAIAQVDTGVKDQALKTLADLSTRFPKAPEATTAYFQRANIYLGDKKFDEMLKVLTEFVDKHPESDQAFSAYERIAALQLQANQTDAAAASYQKFLTSQPDAPQAPTALLNTANLWLRAAQGLGSYVVLGAPQRDAWNADITKAVAACEQQLAKYPEAPATALGLQTLLDCQRLLIVAKTKTGPQVAEYFQGLADKLKDKPGARSRVLFRLASLTAETDAPKALKDMQAAYDPNVVYSPADMDLYTRELMKTDPAAATAVFDKLANDYPLPAGIATPSQAPVDTQDAQAIVLCGRGQIAQAAGNMAAAQTAFAQLKKDYPRSAKAPEADLGLAEALVAASKPDEALPLLSEVARSQKAPVNARARALFLNGKVQQMKGLDGAIDAFLKIAAFYPASPDAAEGLWLGAQALEKQAANLSETPAKPGGPIKSGQLARARKAYEDLIARYASSKWTDQAKQRLSALPKPPPKA